ncbi:MAG: ScyD/ScyE family protein [Anaerolineae bacterium]|nr:ScyD/ScyE family protein [Anaerolineae bacterium]MDQ7034900.1 ScyD/ScyE family protein [Anaerolineae bacterium]
MMNYKNTKNTTKNENTSLAVNGSAHRYSSTVFWLMLCLIIIFPTITLSAQDNNTAEITVLVEGLQNPVGMALLPNGNLLIAEEGTGNDDDSAGVSMLTTDGELGRLISGFASSRDAGDLSGVPLVGVSPDGETIYIGNFNAQHLWTLPVSEALILPETPFMPDELGVAMERLNNVAVINPFDITFAENNSPVVTDASGNGVAIEMANGTTRFIHRFAPLINPDNADITIDPVPTGITRVGDEFYVTLFGGCPYPSQGGELVAIDMNRNQRTVIDNLTMPIDVALAEDGTIWVLQFAEFAPDGSCFTGTDYQANAGKISRLLDDDTLETVVDGLNFPGAVLPLADGSLYITEIFSGRILHITFPDIEIAADTLYFVDVTQEVGITFQQGAFQEGLYPDPVAAMGGGLCWIDYDNDGWLDLYLVNSYANDEVDYWQANGGLPQNQLFRNNGGQFVDVSLESGSNLSMRGNGCAAADLNNDGWTDLVVTAEGANALLWNMGDGTFYEDASTAGINAMDWNTAIAIADVNGDGWLDIFIGSYIDLNNPVPNPIGAFPQDYDGIPDHLYLNLGADESGTVTFRDVTRDVGMIIDERTLGAIFSDLDNDGDLDLYIANDGQPNRLYENMPTNTDIGFEFIDAYDTADANNRQSGMGVAAGDWTGDGQIDLIVTNWDTELNAIYRNQSAEMGYLNFYYSTYRIGMLGLGNNMTGWGTAFADFDHDTDLDLLTVNGRVPIRDVAADAELMRFYGNRMAEGYAGEFREWTERVGFEAVGRHMARGSAVADYDNDGDLDFAVNVIAGQALLLRNEVRQGNWLQIATDSPTPGLLAEVTLPNGQVLRREVAIGSSYLASEDPRLHIGLGDTEIIPLVIITLPDGSQQIFENVAANQILTIDG